MAPEFELACYSPIGYRQHSALLTKGVKRLFCGEFLKANACTRFSAVLTHGRAGPLCFKLLWTPGPSRLNNSNAPHPGPANPTANFSLSFEVLTPFVHTYSRPTLY